MTSQPPHWNPTQGVEEAEPPHCALVVGPPDSLDPMSHVLRDRTIESLARELGRNAFARERGYPDWELMEEDLLPLRVEFNARIYSEIADTFLPMAAELAWQSMCENDPELDPFNPPDPDEVFDHYEGGYDAEVVEHWLHQTDFLDALEHARQECNAMEDCVCDRCWSDLTGNGVDLTPGAFPWERRRAWLERAHDPSEHLMARFHGAPFSSFEECTDANLDDWLAHEQNTASVERAGYQGEQLRQRAWSAGLHWLMAPASGTVSIATYVPGVSTLPPHLGTHLSIRIPPTPSWRALTSGLCIPCGEDGYFFMGDPELTCSDDMSSELRKFGAFLSAPHVHVAPSIRCARPMAGMQVWLLRLHSVGSFATVAGDLMLSTGWMSEPCVPCPEDPDTFEVKPRYLEREGCIQHLPFDSIHGHVLSLARRRTLLGMEDSCRYALIWVGAPLIPDRLEDRFNPRGHSDALPLEYHAIGVDYEGIAYEDGPPVLPELFGDEAIYAASVAAAYKMEHPEEEWLAEIQGQLQPVQGDLFGVPLQKHNGAPMPYDFLSSELFTDVVLGGQPRRNMCDLVNNRVKPIADLDRYLGSKAHPRIGLEGMAAPATYESTMRALAVDIDAIISLGPHADLALLQEQGCYTLDEFRARHQKDLPTLPTDPCVGLTLNAVQERLRGVPTAGMMLFELNLLELYEHMRCVHDPSVMFGPTRR